MARTFAVLSGTSVSNVIVADTQAIAEEVSGLACVEYTDHTAVGIGWTWDGSTFTAPAAQV